MEENITIAENKYMIADFKAHSNKNLLERSGVRITSPIVNRISQENNDTLSL